MEVERISVSQWPQLPDFFIKGISYPIDSVKAENMYQDTVQSHGSEMYKPNPDDVEYQYWALILSVFPVITVFGNILVVLSVLRETNLHTATNYFIVSLAGADIGLAILVMPLSGWVEANNGKWRYSTVFCDIFIMFDVMLCTASILNLVAISMDRYVAVTKPIVYSRHNNNFRIGLTIAVVWILSFIIALPIACGLNNVPHRKADLCVSYNPEYIITSSIGSFYIPCGIMIILYYRVFHAIRCRTKRGMLTNTALDACTSAPKTMIMSSTESAAVDLKESTCQIIQNHGFASNVTTILHQSSLGVPLSKSGRTPEHTVNCKNGLRSISHVNGSREHISVNDKFVCNATNGGYFTQGNNAEHDLYEAEHYTQIETDTHSQFQDMEQFRKHLRDRIRQAKRRSLSLLPVQYSTVSGQQIYVLNKASRKGPSIKLTHKIARSKFVGSRTTLLQKCITTRRAHSPKPVQDTQMTCGDWGASQRRTFFRTSNMNTSQGIPKDRMSAKRERKATKTLAIVLGVFLFCWIPFFTLNIIHAFCFKSKTLNETSVCNLPQILDSIAVWLGYINSFLNPIIYTIFNVEFRKAFKKLLNCSY